MRILLPLFIFLITIPAICQTSLTDGLKVNGVGLGTKQQDIIKKLGRPTRIATTKQIDQCVGGNMRTITYPGLKLELDNAGTGEYTLHTIEVASGDWDLSGVKLGDTMASVQKRFGTRGRHVEKHGREIYWLYEMSEENPGSSNFFFRDGKLFKIQSVYQLC